jgi:hypothetical protein
VGEMATGQVPTAQRKGLSKGWIIGLSIAGAAIVLVMVAVVGGVFFLFRFGLDLVEDQVRRDIQDNPVIMEQVGVIQAIDIDFAASANEPDPEVFVFHLEGQHGNATLTAKTVTVDADTEKVTWGTLRTPSGAQYDLFPGQSAVPD